jgi:hypothetical protein
MIQKPSSRVPRSCWVSWISASIFSVCLLLSYAAAEDNSTNSAPMHWSADRSKMNRKTNQIELRGHARVARDLELLTAEEIDLDLNTDDCQARGQVVYQYNGSVVQADLLDMNMKTKTGTIYNGTVRQGQMAIQGSEFNVLSSDHLIVKDYRYTTCIDCPNAWSIAGKEVDLTFEGYAFIKDFIFKVKDASVAWSPYMVMPIKSKRQSGILFPRFGVSEVHGNFFVLPGFWAINDWSDMTLGVGTYSRRGTRVEWEGRYTLTPRSLGNLKFFWTKDPTLLPLVSARAAASAEMTQEMPLGFEAKLRWFEISDSGYPVQFAEDVPGRFEPVLTSDLFFSRNDPNISTAISLRRIRNLLNFDEAGNFSNGFDLQTVQELPRVVINTNNQFLFGTRIAAGLETRFNRFARGDGPFDQLAIGNSSVDIIREAQRLTLIPSLYTTLNPVPWLSVVPSVQYRSFLYGFSGVYDDLARGYLLTQVEASVQFEKTFETESGDTKYKHTIRPAVQYSTIPSIQQSSDHPFVRSIQNTANTGVYFDNWDIVPLGTTQNLDTYFTPLGNSLSYGLISQLYRKKKSDLGLIPAWRLAEFSILQTLDIRESQRGGIPLSPIFSNLLIEEKDFSWNTEYTYFYALERYTGAQLKSFSSPHRVSTNLKWFLERSSPGTTMTYERSIGVNYSYSKLSTKISSLRTDLFFSLNDYLMPSASLSFDLASENKKFLESRYGILYQSPSRCWRLDASFTRSIDRGVGMSLTFGLNLTGNGLLPVDDSLQKI